MRSSWSTYRLLQVWGLRVSGGRFTLGLSPGSGETSVDEDEAQAMLYVERTPGFYRARPVLVHVLAEMRPVETFQVKRPWESTEAALRRLRWLDLIGEPLERIPGIVFDRFATQISQRVAESPFVPIRTPDEDRAADAVAAVGDKVRRRM